MLAIGVFANRKDKGTENYYVGGRKQNPVTIMCLWVSCWIGGASVIGTSTKGYDMGITAVWYVGMTAMGCLLFSLCCQKRSSASETSCSILHIPNLSRAVMMAAHALSPLSARSLA